MDRPRQFLAIGLAGLAGFVDASGFLSSGGYFTSFMSGNTTRLGVDLVADLQQAALPASLIAGFVIGVVLGALVAQWSGARRKSGVLALALILLLLAALADGAFLGGFLAASVLAMGALNNAFRRDGEVAVGVTYMTGALVRVGQGLAARLLGQPAAAKLSAGGLWLGLAFGAIAGATTFGAARESVSWVAAALCAVLLVAAHVIERRHPHPGS